MKTPNQEETSRKSDFSNFHLVDIPKYLIAYLSDVVDLKKGVDPDKTSQDIISKSSLSGPNSWMLMCSIVIASIGLSQDSQAVIIGAMLISPLMSPILGVGAAIGINDMDALWKSLTQFAIAILIAVLTSYIYFELTPIKTFTEQMQARTEPTFLDIFVAVFGGLAGIISIARKDISTTLPGVAIATALMPPLCVTGYGLAAGDLATASYSFYLFFLNTFFVALATYVIVRYLQFPIRNFLDPVSRRKNVRLIVLFSLALVIPSFLIFNKVLQRQDLDNSIKDFMENCLKEENRILDGYNFHFDTLVLRIYGNPLSDAKRDLYENCLNEYGLNDFELSIISTSEVALDDVVLLGEKVKILASQVDAFQTTTNEQLEIITNYQSTLLDSTLFRSVIEELKTSYTEISEIGMANVYRANPEDKPDLIPTALIKWEEISRSVKAQNDERISKLLKVRMKIDTVQVISY